MKINFRNGTENLKENLKIRNEHLLNKEKKKFRKIKWGKLSR